MEVAWDGFERFQISGYFVKIFIAWIGLEWFRTIYTSRTIENLGLLGQNQLPNVQVVWNGLGRFGTTCKHMLKPGPHISFGTVRKRLPNCTTSRPDHDKQRQQHVAYSIQYTVMLDSIKHRIYSCYMLLFANGSAATRTVQLVHIYVPYVLWLKDQATRKGAVSVPTLRRLWTVSDSFKLR